MSVATALLLAKLLGPAALQLGGQAVGNLHQDVMGYQAVQVAYYQATTAYWNAQRRCCCGKRRRR